MTNAKVQVRRAYQDPAQGDGTRVLVDRIWPRGLTRARAALDEWCKEIAPSTTFGAGRYAAVSARLALRRGMWVKIMGRGPGAGGRRPVFAAQQGGAR